MDFSIMFWGHTEHGTDPNNKYRLLLDVARYADDNGYAALWVPERHFHPWGGLYSNPSVLCAALAMITKRIRLRAGSVVFPLHHPVRIAEEWAAVDNLSGGRVEVSVASGWKDDDFAFAPERYAKRKSETWTALETVRSLWQGKTFAGINGNGKPVEVAIYPRPVQKELPIWVTSAGSLRTFTDAGGSGLNLLTHLLGQDYAALEKKVQQYHAYRVRGGFKDRGKVALMLHAFLGKDRSHVKEIVREPLSEYLVQSADLSIPTEHRTDWNLQDPAVAKLAKEMAAVAFERYFETAALMGTPESCRPLVKRLSEIGITDICCLVDFGVSADLVLESLEYLTELKNAVGGRFPVVV